MLFLFFFFFLNFYSPWNYQKTDCLFISEGMKTIQNSHKTKNETCWIESPKRKIHEFDTNFLKHNNTTAELLLLWHTGIFWDRNFSSHKNSDKPLISTNIFISFFCTRRCWRGHKFQSKFPFISNNFMNKFLDFHILGAFLLKYLSVAIHSKVTIHSFTQVNFFIIYMQFSTNESFSVKVFSSVPNRYSFFLILRRSYDGIVEFAKKCDHSFILTVYINLTY